MVWCGVVWCGVAWRGLVSFFLHRPVRRCTANCSHGERERERERLYAPPHPGNDVEGSTCARMMGRKLLCTTLLGWRRWWCINSPFQSNLPRGVDSAAEVQAQRLHAAASFSKDHNAYHRRNILFMSCGVQMLHPASQIERRRASVESV